MKANWGNVFEKRDILKIWLLSSFRPHNVTWLILLWDCSHAQGYPSSCMSDDRPLEKKDQTESRQISVSSHRLDSWLYTVELWIWAKPFTAIFICPIIVSALFWILKQKFASFNGSYHMVMTDEKWHRSHWPNCFETHHSEDSVATSQSKLGTNVEVICSLKWTPLI